MMVWGDCSCLRLLLKGRLQEQNISLPRAILIRDKKRKKVTKKKLDIIISTRSNKETFRIRHWQLLSISLVDTTPLSFKVAEEIIDLMDCLVCSTPKRYSYIKYKFDLICEIIKCRVKLYIVVCFFLLLPPSHI